MLVLSPPVGQLHKPLAAKVRQLSSIEQVESLAHHIEALLNAIDPESWQERASVGRSSAIEAADD